jgi:hypothetical protein
MESRAALPEDRKIEEIAKESRAALPEDRKIEEIANANGTTHPACTRVHSLRLRFAFAPRD